MFGAHITWGRGTGRQGIGQQARCSSVLSARRGSGSETIKQLCPSIRSGYEDVGIRKVVIRIWLYLFFTPIQTRLRHWAAMPMRLDTC